MKLEAFHHWLESTGISFHTLQFFLIWWRKLGTPGATAVMLAVALPTGGYARLAYSTSHTVPGWIGGFGVELEADDWDIHLFSLSSVAHNAKLRRDAHSAPVLTASEIEFNGTFWTVLSSLWGNGTFNEITIRHGELLVERSLTGDFNWSEFLRGVPEQRRQAAIDGAYAIKTLHLEDFRVVYLEHVPGGSGGGVIRAAEARVIFDGVTGRVDDIVIPETAGARPTHFSAKGRLADGVIEVTGNAGIFPRQILAAPTVVPAATTRQAATTPKADPRRQSGLATVTSEGALNFEMKIYLENIAMGAYGQMTGGTTQILPSTGSLGGNVVVARAPAGGTCDSRLTMTNVGFAANPQAIGNAARSDEINRTLASYRKTGPFDVCGTGQSTASQTGDVQEGTMSGMLATFNVQGTDKAPPSIRALAARDQKTLAGVVADEVADEFLKTNANDSGVTRGIKSVGRGIKRFFGGKGK